MKKGRGMVKGRGMEKRRGMVKGRAYLGPRRHSLVVLDPHHCLRACPSHVASSSSRVSSSCRRWAVLPHHRRRMSGRVIVVPCAPGHIVVLSWSCCCAVSSSLPSHIVVVSRHWSVVIQCLRKVSWEEQGMGGTHHGLLTKMTNDIIIHRLVATSPSAMWHLDPVSEKWMGGGELSHLGLSSPVLAVIGLFVFVCGCSSSFGHCSSFGVVVAASDMALPCCHWWSCAMVVGGRRRL